MLFWSFELKIRKTIYTFTEIYDLRVDNEMVSKPDGLSNKSTMNKPMSIIPIILAVFIIMFLVMSYITGVNPTGRAIAEADNCKDIQVP
ncbi:MAG: hypothetical protein KAJ24_07195, partial [Candidatus Aenigmarchaeota archaeon]|nr:hypothetical protein [Candidatus Aenigmarchaeota archaeon]